MVGFFEFGGKVYEENFMCRCNKSWKNNSKEIEKYVQERE